LYFIVRTTKQEGFSTNSCGLFRFTTGHSLGWFCHRRGLALKIAVETLQRQLVGLKVEIGQVFPLCGQERRGGKNKQEKKRLERLPSTEAARSVRIRSSAR